MKATPIAEYLSRRSIEPVSARATPSANPFLPRREAVANDDGEPEFRRSGLVAALARRSPESRPLVRPLDPAFVPRREAARPAAPAPEPVDLEARLAEAYHRGVQEGLDVAKAEAATSRALERAEMQKRAVIEKLDFQMNEYARLSETIAAAFAELERRVAQSAARVLKPLLMGSIAKQIVDELAENVARLTRSGGVNLVRVRGPERLLAELRKKLATLAVDVEYVEEEGVEISVAAEATEIRSELASWTKLIEDIVENG